ncbi:MAG: hypothetical protein ACE5E9_07650 [Nitrospinaceae bacterium]
MNHEELDHEELNQEAILDLFYANKGNLDKINAILDARLQNTRTRKITLFEKYIQARLQLNSKVLKMVNLDVSPLEVLYLTQYPGLRDLEILDLRKNGFGDEGLDAIAHAPMLKNLRELDLRNNLITRRGVVSFSQSKTLRELEKLDLRCNKLGKSWEQKLKDSGNFPKLMDLKTA